MEEKNYRKWDIILKGLTPLAILIGIIFGMYQYHTSNDGLKKQEDAKELVEVISFLANSDLSDSSVYDKSKIARFWELYELVSMEEKNVQAKIASFGNNLKKYLTTTDNASKKQNIQDSMKYYSYQIAQKIKIN